MTESEEQTTSGAYFRLAYPNYAKSLRVSQSGSFRGNGKRGAIRTTLVKVMGGVTGESDIAVLIPRGNFGCLLMEHKSDENVTGPTKDQLDYIKYHNSIGNLAFVTKGVAMAIKTIDDYMGLEI